MTALQTYLRDGGSLEQLQTDLAIKVSRHPEFPHLVLLKYNQIETPMSNLLARECRGIILDEQDNWRIVSRAFDKFFNHGEGHAAEIDWLSAEVQEKMDGSLVVVYPYDGRWHVATSGSPHAGGDVHGDVSRTFADYFWETFTAHGASLPDRDYMSFCLFFELTGPSNRVVVQHADTKLTLLGARELVSQREIPAKRATDLFTPGSIRPVQSFPLYGLKHMLDSFERISPLAQEGYVVVDSQFNRIKVKHPGYVALHHAKDGLSARAFVDIARCGEVPELLSAFPEIAPRVDAIKEKYDALVSRLEAEYDRNKDAPDQKTFAMAVKDLPMSSALFQVRAGKAKSIRDYLSKCNVDPLMSVLGVSPQD